MSLHPETRTSPEVEATRMAHVYIFEARDGSIKVGHSIHPHIRMYQVGGHDLKCRHVSAPRIDAERVERAAHRLLFLAGKRIRGEWFNATLEDALDAIERAERIADGLEELPPLPLRNDVDRPVIHLKLSDAAQEFLEEERLSRTVPPSKNAIAREAVLLGIEVMRARRSKKS